MEIACIEGLAAFRKGAKIMETHGNGNEPVFFPRKPTEIMGNGRFQRCVHGVGSNVLSTITSLAIGTK